MSERRVVDCVADAVTRCIVNVTMSVIPGLLVRRGGNLYKIPVVTSCKPTVHKLAATGEAGVVGRARIGLGINHDIVLASPLTT